MTPAFPSSAGVTYRAIEPGASLPPGAEKEKKKETEKKRS
jgi:hypothetical protein